MSVIDTLRPIDPPTISGTGFSHRMVDVRVIIAAK